MTIAFTVDEFLKNRISKSAPKRFLLKSLSIGPTLNEHIT